MRAGSTSIRTTGARDPVEPRADDQPVWSPDRTVVGTEERMLTLAYRVVREVGYSPRASRRLCRRLFRAMPPRPDTPRTAPPDSVRPDSGRRTRARLVAALRAAVPTRVDIQALERALDGAVLADELTLLPPRQQAALRWALQQGCTVSQISERTGWTPHQVARLLQAGLTTLTICGAARRTPTGPLY
jgi:DNA-directed RNA polymerase specialized sigma24 family protein